MKSKENPVFIIIFYFFNTMRIILVSVSSWKKNNRCEILDLRFIYNIKSIIYIINNKDK